MDEWIRLSCLEEYAPEMPHEKQQCVVAVDNGSGCISYDMARYERGAFHFKNGPYGETQLFPTFKQNRGNAYSVYAWKGFEPL